MTALSIVANEGAGDRIRRGLAGIEDDRGQHQFYRILSDRAAAVSFLRDFHDHSRCRLHCP
jgi:hypothetical protein